MSQLFDVAFVLPGTNIRFGVEAILRLVPGIGVIAASALSCFLLYQAHRLGVPRHVFARMIAGVMGEGPQLALVTLQSGEAECEDSASQRAS